jgi:16S rRNA U1498 N3-methylase RsmE
MHRFFIAKAFQEKMTISGMDAHHIQDVLRLKIGDKVQIVADDGVVALGEITAWEKGKVFLQCTKNCGW